MVVESVVLALTFGLLGSLSHCVGMCSGFTLLFHRRNVITNGSTLVAVHLGRILMYGILGLIGGMMGKVLGKALPGQLRWVQGGMGLVAAIAAIYFGLALLGRMPSPEILLVGFTKRWGRTFRGIIALRHVNEYVRLPFSFVVGLLWGLLPCGLVITAVLTAAVSGSALQGALNMLAFGAGTLPALFGIGWLSGRRLFAGIQWPRLASAVVVWLFGAQVALRGLAAWGMVGHLHLAGVMVW